jgi:cyclopropane fatty-acyl-phospholipid synthase-like methyltransferase
MQRNILGKCLLCDEAQVQEFLDLGRTALANKFLSKEELSTPEPKYPLKVGFCHGCGHVQLMELVPPEAMFDHYLYVSSASDTLKSHLWDLSDDILKRYQLGADDLVIDIGCNDATLLHGFKRYGVRTLGVDPAQNLAELTSENGIERCTALFNSETAEHIVSRWGKASIITATNTFPHIQKLPDFVDGIKTVLKPGGAFVIEMHYLLDLIEQVAFDTVYHEHVSYWALGPMKQLFESNGMTVVDAERVPLHHGQLRVQVQRQGEGQVRPGVAEILALEKAAGLDRFETYERFAERALNIKKDLHETLAGFARKGQRVAGYGAPAKGNTLLGFLEIGPELLPYIVDRSLLKQGLYTPGTHIPVVAPERLLTDQPDYVLLLAWNFVDEVLAQQTEYLKRGGRFMVPVPEVRVV